MKKSVCELVNKNNKTYIKDYRLRRDIEILKGNLNDLSKIDIKSKYIGSVIRHVPNDRFNDLVIIQYKNGFALGKLKNS
ncbi:hypothetical protein [Staphylococcus chromogenes]|uniref:hypothetical protein n=1 Tax=Staphylococcus chromogenes TaxID=46126 RepID=UPI0028846474|nr:hypothetical protein [Staphylococcus chromogenes]MDT0700405.1 hypothetical protein [Staphylococcus chromogenes]